MSQPHIYGLHSRLGLRFKPHRSEEVNQGVEDGPDPVMAGLFPTAPFEHARFSAPEEVETSEYFKVIAQESRAAADLIINTLNVPTETPIMVGGDHSIAYASLLALQDLYPVESTAIVMFDSHADLHQTATTPTGNFHGMWLRPFFDVFDVEVIHRQVKHQYRPEQLRYIGNLVVEEAELDFLTRHQIHQTSGSWFSDPALRQQAVTEFEDWTSSHQHLHVSFDIDMFRADLVPATGTTNPNGVTPEQVWPFLEVVARHPQVSIDVVEVNPRKSGAEATIALAQKALKTMLG